MKIENFLLWWFILFLKYIKIENEEIIKNKRR